MRILVVSQYFWPETFIISDIVRKLVEQGHEVTVATGKPNYPDGQVFSGYRAAGVVREDYIAGVEIVRVPLWPRGRGGALNLILNYASFVFFGCLYFPWLLRGKAFDSIFVFAPSPVTQVAPAILLKWLKRARLTLWVQDLWPESLEATGFIRNKALLKFVGFLVKALYGGCDQLLVQSRAFIDPVSRYASPSKIRYYPNSMDATAQPCVPDLPAEFVQTLKSHFCVMFAGNLGAAQALDVVVEAAQALRADNAIRLVLVGSGSRSAWLEEQKNALGLDNLILAGRYPMTAMPSLYSYAGALLVSLTAEPIFEQTVPSKIQAYLAAGRPVIAALNGEGAAVISESGAGVICPAEQVSPLVMAIRRMSTLSSSERDAMGRAGRAYFEEHFEMGQQVKTLARLLNNDTAERGGSL